MKSHPGGIGRKERGKNTAKILNMQTRRLVLIGRRRCRPVFKNLEKKNEIRERKKEGKKP